MAITGGFQTITPSRRSAGFPLLLEVPEASALTHYEGWPMFLSGGYASSGASNQTLIYGFSAIAGNNGASDGAKTARLYRVTPGAEFEATLSVASWDQSLVGSKVAISVISSKAVLVTATALSASAQCVVLGVSSRWGAGDNKPVVFFTVLHADMQGEV